MLSSKQLDRPNCLQVVALLSMYEVRCLLVKHKAKLVYFHLNKVSKRISRLSSWDFWASELWSKSGREEGEGTELFSFLLFQNLKNANSTTPFRLIINDHFSSENKICIFRSLLTLFSFKILKTKTITISSSV